MRGNAALTQFAEQEQEQERGQEQISRTISDVLMELAGKCRITYYSGANDDCDAHFQPTIQWAVTRLILRPDAAAGCYEVGFLDR